MGGFPPTRSQKRCPLKSPDLHFLGALRNNNHNGHNLALDLVHRADSRSMLHILSPKKPFYVLDFSAQAKKIVTG